MTNYSDSEMDMVLEELDDLIPDDTPSPAVVEMQPTTSSSSNSKPFYKSLMNSDIEALQTTADRIRERHRSSIIETGKDLMEIQNNLPKLFVGWLEVEFSMSVRTAWNYIRAAKEFGSTPKIIDVLPPATIYKLAASGTPDTLRQAVVKEIESGVPVTKEDVERRIAEAKNAGKPVVQRKQPAKLSKEDSKKAALEAASLLRTELGKHYEAFRKLLERTSDGMLRWAMDPKNVA